MSTVALATKSEEGRVAVVDKPDTRRPLYGNGCNKPTELTGGEVMRLENVQHSTNIRIVSSAVALASHGEMQPQGTLSSLADRRRSPRFRVGNELLCVSDDYAGQILDISPTGLAFQLVKFRPTSAKVSSMPQPRQSEKLNILHAGPLSFFIMKNLQVKGLHDLATGLLYPGNAEIVNYRRGVSFAVPLAEKEFDALHPYLAVA